MKTHRSWMPVIRELHNRFMSLEDQIVLLNDIDKHILEKKYSLEQTYVYALKKIPEIFNIISCYCYVNTGEKFVILKGDNSTINNRPIQLKASKILTEWENDTFKLLDSDCNKKFFINFKCSKTIVLYPLFYPKNHLFCIFLLSSKNIKEGSILCDISFREYFESVVRQLEIATKYFFRQEKDKNVNKIWSSFLKDDIAPTKCFKYLVDIMPQFFTSFGPVEPKGELSVQILVNDAARKNLIIRSSSTDIPDTTRVRYDRSISGLLIQESLDELPYFYDNPMLRKYAHLYKDYSTLNPDYKTQSELAVRLQGDDNQEIIGVLNFESSAKKAFSRIHIINALKIAQYIAPIVLALENRLHLNREMHYALTDTTSKYLDGLGKSFNHLVGTPSATLKSDIELIEKLIDSCYGTFNEEKECSSMLKSALERMYTSLNHILATTSDFTGKISGFSVKGKNNIKHLIDDTVNLFKKSVLGKRKDKVNIRIDCTAHKSFTYCSPLLIQHMFCLLMNSYLSIKDRIKNDSSEGVIFVTGRIVKSAGKFKENELNKEYVISITDNGVGVSRNELNELKKFQFGVRYRSGVGSGYGLVAVQRYLASIEGRIELESERNIFFEVKVYLDIWSDILHGPLGSNNAIYTED